jgi:hypothetical protein
MGLSSVFRESSSVPVDVGSFCPILRRFLMSSVTKWISFAFGAGLVLAGMSGVASAHMPGTPEIDAGSMANALMVACGSLLILRGRLSRK